MTGPLSADDALAIFRTVLETEDVAVDDDFFDLGGDSLLATRVLSALARATGEELTMEDFLMAPTPELLAARLGAGAGAVGVGGVAGVVGP
jgi:acyl carrier protein